VTAACLTRIFYTSSFKTTLPFVFLGIIVLVTIVFGRKAGVLGTLGAALIFASVLFEPRPSLAMQDPVAQTHLIWMIVIGVVVADLLGQRKSTQETAVIAAKTGQPKVSH
jgi:K+-sensing histidine kinase KdpD